LATGPHVPRDDTDHCHLAAATIRRAKRFGQGEDEIGRDFTCRRQPFSGRRASLVSCCCLP